MNALSALRCRSSAAASVVVSAVFAYAGAAGAHEGHGATPAHVHGVGGLPIDVGAVGAAVVIAVIGVVAVVNFARARR